MPYNLSSNLQVNLGQQAVSNAIIVVWPNQADQSGMTPVEASVTLTEQAPIIIENNFTPSIVQTTAQIADSTATFSIANPGIETSAEDIPNSVSVSEL